MRMTRHPRPTEGRAAALICDRVDFLVGQHAGFSPPMHSELLPYPIDQDIGASTRETFPELDDDGHYDCREQRRRNGIESKLPRRTIAR